MYLLVWFEVIELAMTRMSCGEGKSDGRGV